jgi:enoyl-CoA hydratase
MRGMRHIEYSQTDHVGSCVISNPPAHSLTTEGVRELTELFERLEGEGSLRVLVIWGGGDGVFIQGREISELAARAERESKHGAAAGAEPASNAPLRLHPLHQMVLKLERLPAITVAALNGNAVGVGYELALACDFRVMMDGKFHVGLPEIWLGLIPGTGGTQRMSRLIGVSRTLDLIMHGALLSPQQALELGLLHRLFAAGEFDDEVHKFAANLAARAPLALRAAKRVIREGAALELEQALHVEQQQFERVLHSEDARGAMRAWLEREPYTWKGE